MTFAILCTIAFFALSVGSDMGKFLKYMCVFMCLYSVYTVATHLGIVQELFPKDWNPLLDWGRDTFGNLTN